jgi:hypothetical protein
MTEKKARIVPTIVAISAGCDIESPEALLDAVGDGCEVPAPAVVRGLVLAPTVVRRLVLAPVVVRGLVLGEVD